MNENSGIIVHQVESALMNKENPSLLFASERSVLIPRKTRDLGFFVGKINMATNWIEYDPLSLLYSGVSNSPCVYCVQIDGITVYVGSTRRFRSRFYEHKFRHGYANNIHLPWCSVDSKTKVCVKVGYTKKYGDWAMRELRLIKKLKPIYNIAHKSPRIQK